jgi:dTDP-4-amino-4,6-dideoxygalactose transaminase
MIEYENLRKANAPFEEEYNLFLSAFLKKGRYILGDEVDLFENEFAKYCGAKFCIGVASGLDALYLSLLALDIPKHAEIIVPSNTYIATILSILQAGLKPVLVEPRLDSYNIDPKLIESKITKSTKAIMVVHLYGTPCNMEEITKIADAYQIPIIEDCAQAHGAKFFSQRVGTFGTFGAFSFYPTKNLGAMGDAGAIITNDEEYALKLRALRNYGSHKKCYNKYIGINSRLDELQAGFLKIKLKRIDQITLHKQKLATVYLDNLDSNKFVLPIQPANTESVFHIFPIRSNTRDTLKEFLYKKGIQTEIHYPIPPHKQEAYKYLFKKESFPVSEQIHDTVLSLPISFFHTEQDVLTVCDKLNSYP